jgi:mannose-6-phosphate isomerase
MVELLDCTVMPYAWGSRTAIAELRGRPSPAPGPEAELWMGAHAMAPSRVAATGRSLAEVIAADPRGQLGAAAVSAFGDRLPFLLKVLAAAEPLSIQAHPTEEQARAGFEEEERRGVPRDAPRRNYRDPSHKPELLCALTPFEALCGFRDVAETARLFDELAVPALDEALAPLRAGGDLGETFRRVMTTLDAAAVEQTVAACARPGGFARERAMALSLARLYPGDVGVVSALLLNLLHLEPGEAIYLGAGNLHAYLGGVGVEIMASSDNVLRGGLTPKHVDVPELMRVLRFEAGPIAPLRARRVDAVEEVYDTPAREFRLSRVTAPAERAVRGPEILLCTAGDVRVDDRPLPRGGAAFVPASAGRWRLSGEGTVYRATVNL